MKGIFLYSRFFLFNTDMQLKYHETGKEKDCLPQVGQWNMMNKVTSISIAISILVQRRFEGQTCYICSWTSHMQKMINGMTVNRWACINFSQSVQDSIARGFCSELAQMCQVSGMVLFYFLRKN